MDYGPGNSHTHDSANPRKADFVLARPRDQWPVEGTYLTDGKRGKPTTGTAHHVLHTPFSIT